MLISIETNNPWHKDLNYIFYIYFFQGKKFPHNVKMATIENMKWLACAQTSVDPDDNPQGMELRVVVTLSKEYMRHHCRLSSKQQRGLKEHVETLVRVGDEVEQKHRSLFRGMIKRLDVCSQSKVQLKELLRRVFDEMFADNHQNWGRIVTVLVFGACVSKTLLDKNHKELADMVAEYVGESVHTRSHEWVSKQGGWVSTFFFFAQNILFNNVL